MGYYQQPKPDVQLGAVPVFRAIRGLGGVVRTIGPGRAIGGVPRQRDVRRAMEDQGEAFIPRSSGFSVLRDVEGRGQRLGVLRNIAQASRNPGIFQSIQDEIARREAARGGAPNVPAIPFFGAGRQPSSTGIEQTPPQLPLAPFNPLAPNIETLPVPMTLGDYGMGAYGPPGRLASAYDARFGLGNSTVVYGMGDELAGFSFKSIARAVKRVASPVQHALTAVGHETGKIVTSKVGQVVIGGVLAATGVGIPAAAAIMGGTKAFGNLIKPGGNLKHFATGAFQGAAEGVAAAGVGNVLRSGAARSAESFVGHAVKAVGSGVLHGAGAVLHGVESLGKAVIGIPGSFIPTSRDPNGDGINSDTGNISDEAQSAQDAGRAVDGRRLPYSQKPRVGFPGQFPRSADDPFGTGISQSTGDMTGAAQQGVNTGAATPPGGTTDTTPPPTPYTAPYGGGGGGGGGGFDSGGGDAAAAGLAAGAAGADLGAGAGALGGLGGLLGGINPVMALAGVAAFIFVPKLIGGGKRGGGSRRRSAPRRRSRRRR